MIVALPGRFSYLFLTALLVDALENLGGDKILYLTRKGLHDGGSGLRLNDGLFVKL